MSATVPQNLQALAEGNVVRLDGLRLRREMTALPPAESRARAAALLRNPPPALTHMEVGYFLCGIRRVGRRRAVGFINHAAIGGAYNRPLGGARREGHLRPLTDRERLALADAVEAGP